MNKIDSERKNSFSRLEVKLPQSHAIFQWTLEFLGIISVPISDWSPGIWLAFIAHRT